MTAIVSDIGFGAETAFVLIANGVSRTFVIRFAADNSDASNSGIRIGDRARWTSTIKGSCQVIANGTFAARVRFSAFIQINAQPFGVSGKAWRTLARISTRDILADGVVSALARRSMHRVTLIDIDTTSSDVAGIEGPSLFTHTVRLCAIGLAVGVRSASYVFTWGLALNAGRCSNISRKAFTLERSWSVDALSVGSTDTGSCAALIDIQTH